MNNKGQALIEFVLILPIFLLILFVIVDFCMIFNAKLKLENDCEDIVMLIRDGKDISYISDIYSDIDIDVMDYSDDLIKVRITDSVNVITPGLDRILGDPYEIEIERIINRDEA